MHVGRCPLPCLLAGCCLRSGQCATQAVNSVVLMNSASRVINQRLTDDFRGCTMQQSAQIRRRGEFASGVKITGTQQGNGLETAGQPIPVCQMSIRRDVSHIRGKRRLQQTSTPSWRHTCHHTGSVILVHKSWAQDCSLFLRKLPVPSFGYSYAIL